jgi:hypothetical protein
MTWRKCAKGVGCELGAGSATSWRPIWLTSPYSIPIAFVSRGRRTEPERCWDVRIPRTHGSQPRRWFCQRPYQQLKDYRHLDGLQLVSAATNKGLAGDSNSPATLETIRLRGHVSGPSPANAAAFRSLSGGRIVAQKAVDAPRKRQCGSPGANLIASVKSCRASTESPCRRYNSLVLSLPQLRLSGWLPSAQSPVCRPDDVLNRLSA